jgi:hypothetical protein
MKKFNPLDNRIDGYQGASTAYTGTAVDYHWRGPLLLSIEEAALTPMFLYLLDHLVKILIVGLFGDSTVILPPCRLEVSDLADLILRLSHFQRLFGSLVDSSQTEYSLHKALGGLGNPFESDL